MDTLARDIRAFMQACKRASERGPQVLTWPQAKAQLTRVLRKMDEEDMKE